MNEHVTENKHSADRVVPSSVYWDAETYERELELIFGKTWLFVGHESMVRNAGDYITNFMGDDPVIVCRGKDNRIHVMLNRCRHRGNKVCLYDRGRAKSFRCSYHGWTYGLGGELAAVPLLKEAYGADFHREEYGLVEAPQVASYKGLLFASWNVSAVPLADHLGPDLRWYLDTFLLDDPAGLEALPGCHRYIIPGNWKHLAENFGGDLYHFATTHASVVALTRQKAREDAPADHGTSGGFAATQKLFGVTFTKDTPPHGILMLSVGDQHSVDIKEAETLSPAAVEWVKKRHERRQAAVEAYDVKPNAFNIATIWPNLSMAGIAPALSGRSLFVWHPRGPEETEMRQWCFVEKSAPLEVKQRMSAVMTWRQSATGMVGTDDSDNFQRMRDALHTNRAKGIDFNYDLGRSQETDRIDPPLPGELQPAVSESYQRAFYRHWHDLMER
jgi:phenylpropionate dioxygenase-like ring-hydroxylating dioxygenase large terminal subunit